MVKNLGKLKLWKKRMKIIEVPVNGRLPKIIMKKLKRIKKNPVARRLLKRARRPVTTGELLPRGPVATGELLLKGRTLSKNARVKIVRPVATRELPPKGRMLSKIRRTEQVRVAG